MKNKIAFNKDYPDISESNKLYERSKGLIPAFTQTLAKGPEQYVNGVAPKYLKKGKNAHVWDVDGNEFIDLNMGIGPLSIGYCIPEIDEAIKNQLADGITFSLMHPLEVEVAELIREVVPNAEAVRYSKTGADVVSAAVRLARAWTKKKKVLCCGYHGWHDWYIAVTDRNAGIPQVIEDMSFTFNYNDIDSVIDSIDDDVACIILEPFVFQEPKDDFLQKLRKICDENNILLIFDEMWTGFRVALGGAQEFFGVNADLALFSKAVANGMPIAMITGRKDVMALLDKDVFFFTTFGGEALSLAATKATIEFIRKYDAQKIIAQKGKRLKDGYNRIATELGMNYTSCTGFECRTVVNFDPSAGNPLEMKSLLQQEMIKRGVLWGGFHNVCYSLTEEDIDHVLAAYREALSILKEAVENKKVAEMLRGVPVSPVFRKIANFNMKPKNK
ncbi:MAG: aminotransferase class III-fold pyridoxal phosphate-dependent enzyme [Ignavibacteriales bacterium]|nr:MAG: aminotransferase class III-fold pyridoxal phosphate-dependent enzyme [Ignavibacteriaceae bacterium]MBW7871903.1 aminotransferase class III-fold pyridoxal phosphate-dependent enzyme [Ignavibacteria bacterium]MCZ2144247.1 aminotransferase class III-fold pyridoxal phosphate-dependent enzyme [Ignavibacteriales bacterium]MBV6446200.1 3-aminobutyryl-CoA aminotransferase [Ignavibacteriaceae bacterium]MBZ0195967.1 aminotransferase class III-fold pyridoxal phosphate-dependent enzyme [Ignavibacte